MSGSGEVHSVVVSEEQGGKRIDGALALAFDVPRARIAEAIDNGLVSVDGKAAKKRSQRLVEGTTVKAALVPPRTLETLPQDIPLEILYEDDHVVVVNKPTGMVVHPAAGHPDGTLVNALLFHCAGRLSSVGGAIRPGIVHRIDKDTSGVLVCSKTDEAHVLLQQQFAAHTVKRQYMALSARTTGRGIGESGTFHTRHGRHLTDRKKFTGKSGEREAITHYEVIESFRDGARLVRCELETGRTHQIRVHLAEAGAPILGDPIYGGTSVARSPLVTRTALHAQTLGFIAPNGEELYFEADLPEDFQNALDRLRRGATWRK